MKKLLVLPLLLLTACVSYYQPQTALQDGVYYAQDDPGYRHHPVNHIGTIYYPWYSVDYFYFVYAPYGYWGYSPWYSHYYAFHSPWYRPYWRHHRYAGWYPGYYPGYYPGHYHVSAHDENYGQIHRKKKKKGKKKGGDFNELYAGVGEDDRSYRSLTDEARRGKNSELTQLLIPDARVKAPAYGNARLDVIRGNGAQGSQVAGKTAGNRQQLTVQGNSAARQSSPISSSARQPVAAQRSSTWNSRTSESRTRSTRQRASSRGFSSKRITHDRE